MNQQIIIAPTLDTVVIDVTVDVKQTNIPPTPVNQSPVVSVGVNQTIQLPVNSVTLTGAGSVDPDGTISSYQWTKVSGGNATITNPAAVTTTVTGLVEGNYQFRLTVTDNKGATASAVINIIVQAAVVVTPPPTGYKLTFSKDFDLASDFSINQIGRGVMSTTVVKTGKGSFKSEVRVGDDAISQGFRSEQQYQDAGANPTEGAVEYDALYESFTQPGWGGSSIQWHENNVGTASLSLYTAEQKFNVYTLGKGYQQNGPAISINRWYHIRWEFKWSLKTDGYVRLFIDGIQTFTYSGVTLDPKDSGLPYIKLGQNFWSSDPNPLKSVHGGVVYYDNFKVYTKS
jgi:hypothetical protein